MLQKTVPDPDSGEWKCSVAVLRVGYGEQTVHETKRNADPFETATLLDDEVRQRGMTLPGHEDICKPERPACNLSAIELLDSVIGIEVIALW